VNDNELEERLYELMSWFASSAFLLPCSLSPTMFLNASP
jgi:hypothetical protein